MARYFTLATDPLTAEQTKALKDAMSGKGWWHWLPNYWLIKDATDTLTVDEITAIIGRIAPQARALAVEVEKRTWSARTKPNAKGESMTAWLHSNWGTP